MYLNVFYKGVWHTLIYAWTNAFMTDDQIQSEVIICKIATKRLNYVVDLINPYPSGVNLN